MNEKFRWIDVASIRGCQ